MQSGSSSDSMHSPLRCSILFPRRDAGLTPWTFFYRSLRERVEPFASSILLGALILLSSSASFVHAQTNNTPFPQPTELQQGPPLTNEEFVRLLYQLPAHPNEAERLIDDVRKRGIAFAITPGLRSLVATKSGNDASLMHTLEEAHRPRANPAPRTALPPIAVLGAPLYPVPKC